MWGPRQNSGMGLIRRLACEITSALIIDHQRAMIIA